MARTRTPAPPEKRQRWLKLLVFSPEGWGKTYFLGTAVFDPRTTPIFILDFEGGVEDVLEGLPGGPDGPDWYYIRIRTWDDFNEAYERLVKNEEGAKACAIDSLSETHIFALMNLLDERPAQTRKEEDLISIDEYGIALVQIRRLVRYFRDLPLHVFYTAHHKEENDPRQGLVRLVNLSGKAATEIPGLMTAVGYLGRYVGDDKKFHRVLVFGGDAKLRTKVRMPWGKEAPDEIEDPTVTAVLDALGF